MNELFRLDHGALSIREVLIDTPYEVDSVITCSGLIIAKVNPPAGTPFNRNVFAYRSDGHRVWQIEESPHGTQTDKPYMDIRIDRHGVLIAGNWNGVNYSVDLQSGEVTPVGIEK